MCVCVCLSVLRPGGNTFVGQAPTSGLQCRYVHVFVVALREKERRSIVNEMQIIPSICHALRSKHNSDPSMLATRISPSHNVQTPLGYAYYSQALTLGPGRDFAPGDAYNSQGPMLGPSAGVMPPHPSAMTSLKRPREEPPVAGPGPAFKRHFEPDHHNHPYPHPHPG